jgi:multidrug efflux pump subunit AcrA (membrane-fusion protein)
VSATAPALRSDLSIIEQTFRGERSYVVKDLAAQKYFRFGATEVRVMKSFDGRRTPQEIAIALAEEGIRVSTQAIEGFARKLSNAGFLERTLAERSTLQMERLRAERQKRRRPALFRGELLRMRWSFGDPDAWLARVLPGIRWMFTPALLAASSALFAIYFVILFGQWPEYKAALASMYTLHTITLGSFAVLWLTGLVVILIHELGHAFTCKYFGGEVRELGFMLLYFQPAFYCNVSDAWSFPERRARLWVTAAGTWIQLVIASLAAMTWWSVKSGTLISMIAVAGMLIGGVMTMLTNMNPLLPLDGYFALTDWLEIPNLRHRAIAHFGWWVRRHVFRLEVSEPAASARERRVFLIYGGLAAAYISVLFVVLATWALGKARQTFGILGAVAASVAILLLLRPRLIEWGRTARLVLRSLRATWRASTRKRRIVVPLLLASLVLFAPWTLTSSGGFVVQPAMTHVLVAPDSGIVASVMASEGMRVSAGTALVQLVDRALDEEILAAGRDVDSLSLAESAARAAGRAAEAERLAAAERSAVALLAGLESRAGQLTLRALTAGVVVTPRPEVLTGRRVEPGEEVLRVATLDSVEVRIALPGGGATSVRPGSRVHLFSLANPERPWTGRVTDVSVAGVVAGSAPGLVEARVRLAAAPGWMPGVHGEASVELGRSIVLGALWWKLRQVVRGDLLL